LVASVTLGDENSFEHAVVSLVLETTLFCSGLPGQDTHLDQSNLMSRRAFGVLPTVG